MSNKKLLWLCRRGMKELDLMMLDYLNNEYSQAEKNQQEAFIKLLGYQDPVIVDLLFSRITDEDENINKLIKYLQHKAEKNKV